MKKLTQAKLDEIHDELMNRSIPIKYNKKGEPLFYRYRIIVDVTEEEYRALRKKLKSMRQ